MFLLHIFLAVWTVPVPQEESGAAGLIADPWWIAGSFALENSGRGKIEGFSPEMDLAAMRSKESWPGLSKEYKLAPKSKGKETGTWTRLPDIRKKQPLEAGAGPLAIGEIDFLKIPTISGSREGWNSSSAVYLYRSIHMTQPQVVEIVMGSDDGLQVWLNGLLLMVRYDGRSVDPLDETLALPLRKGRNHLLVKVVQKSGGWGLAINHSWPVSAGDISDAIDRGVDWLLSRQLVDGSWGSLQGIYPNGATSLAVFTLLKSGVSKEHPAIRQALAWLAIRPPRKTYSAGVQMMAIEAAELEEGEEWLEEIAGDLLSWQLPNGEWNYPGGSHDLSLLQFAALGLSSAMRAKIAIPRRAWERLARAILRYQEDPHELPGFEGRKVQVAGFSYHAGGLPRLSMTAAGVSTAQLALDYGELPAVLKRQLQRAIELGAAWIGGMGTVRNAGVVNDYQRFYCLYGVERAAAFLEMSKFGNHDWYQEGARWLLTNKKKGGFWSLSRPPSPALSGEPEISTCFALLFLRKASGLVSVSGRDHGGSERLDSPGGCPVLHVVPGDPVIFWIDPPKSPFQVDNVEYFFRRPGGEWKYLEQSAPFQDSGETPSRFAARHSFARAGILEIRATLISPEGATQESGIVSFRLINVLDPERLAWAEDAFRNLVQDGNVKVTVSSGQGNPLVDNRPDTAWYPVLKDTQRTIQLQLNPAVKANRLLLTPSRNRLSEQKKNPRPSQVKIWINKEKDPILLNLDRDGMRKSTLKFQKTLRIQTLRIQITEVVEGTIGKDWIGFAEIELQKT